MANPYFKYKQFTVHHDQCAMKVCTDSSLFGAIISAENSKKILDIGAGSGVLSLMQAQKSDAEIIAVEIDKAASKQAEENFANSPWPDQLKVVCMDVVDFAATNSEKFDMIISNPPFFERNLKTSDERVNRARHDDTLNFEKLALVVNQLLSEHGVFWVLLPPYEFEQLENRLSTFLYKQADWNIYDRPGSKLSRKVGAFVREEVHCENKSLNIKDESGRYSHEFEHFLKDYYLIF